MYAPEFLGLIFIATVKARDRDGFQGLLKAHQDKQYNWSIFLKDSGMRPEDQEWAVANRLKSMDF